MTSTMSLGVVTRTLVGMEKLDKAQLGGHWHMDNRQEQTVSRFGTFFIPQGWASETHFKGGGPEHFGSASWSHNLISWGLSVDSLTRLRAGCPCACTEPVWSQSPLTPFISPSRGPTDTTPSRAALPPAWSPADLPPPCCKPE